MTPQQLQDLKQRPASVPCGACSACCKKDTVILDPLVDDLTAYSWHTEGARLVLDRKPSGECLYLTSQGCGIHARRPDICKRMDCRVLFLTTPKDLRRIRVEQNPTMREVYDAGKKRLNTLEG